MTVIWSEWETKEINGSHLIILKQSKNLNKNLLVITELSEDDEAYSFNVTFHGPGDRSFVLSAENQESMEEWMKAITCASYDYMKVMVTELQKQVDELTGSKVFNSIELYWLNNVLKHDQNLNGSKNLGWKTSLRDLLLQHLPFLLDIDTTLLIYLKDRLMQPIQRAKKWWKRKILPAFMLAMDNKLLRLEKIGEKQRKVVLKVALLLLKMF